MPTFTQTVPPPEFDGIIPFIQARFPGTPINLSPTWNNKVASLECPNLTTAQFNQLILDLTAAFPFAMGPDNDSDVVFEITSADAQIWVAMPAALTEFRGVTVHRAPAFLAAKKEAILSVNVQAAGVAGAGLRVQASLDGGTNWRALDSGTGPQVAVDTVGVKTSAVIALDTAVRTAVLLRVVGGGGNGVASPSFGTIILRVR